ncbi:MAG: hypothetical protein ACPIOQ_32380, partial [Promethearchaeia archaeon]
KLEYVKNLFHDEKLAATAGFNAASPATSHLAVIAIYLFFLSTGQVVFYGGLFCVWCVCVCVCVCVCSSRHTTRPFAVQRRVWCRMRQQSM